MGVVRLLLGKMAVNRDLEPLEVVRSNIVFIQRSIAASGLATVAGYLLQSNLITRQNHDDALTPSGRGPVDQAAMLMRTVELKIESDPDLYFPRFTQTLRSSNMGDVADRLEQQARSLRMRPEYAAEAVPPPRVPLGMLWHIKILE